MRVNTIVSGKIDNNTYVVTNENKECIIVDCACELEKILKVIEDCKVVAVLLTHGHYDHFVNLDKIVNHFKVKCYVSNLDFEKLYNPKMNYSIIFNKFFSTKLLEEDFVVLKESVGSFSIEGFDVSYFLTPGHTNGSLCYLVNNEILFTGDTIFSSSYGRTDLLTGSEEDMKNSLTFLKEKFCGVKFYPGHGEFGVIT